MREELMREGLNHLLEAFAQKLTPWESNQYIPKIRDYLFPYILQNKKNIESIKLLFEELFNRDDIKGSCKKYVLSDGVKSLTSIDDYLTAFNQFFELILMPIYPNQNLILKRPFNYLGEEIANEVLDQKELKRAEEILPIQRQHYEFIMSYINTEKNNDLKMQQIKIIIKLLLIYGFSFYRIKELETTDFKEDTQTLSLVLNKNQKVVQMVHLELPYDLSREIGCYIKRKEKDKTIYLFSNDDGTQIKPCFTQYYIKKIRKAYSKIDLKPRDEKRFTNTGLAMYAIVNMLRVMNQSTIMELTDMGADVILTCQNELDTKEGINKNRNINCAIRGIAVYDDFQKSLSHN